MPAITPSHPSPVPHFGLRRLPEDCNYCLSMGTHNPATVAHLESLVNALRLKGMKLDKGYFIPAFQPPHKNPSVLADFDDRIKILELSAKGHDNIDVLDIERYLPTPSYTMNTIQELLKHDRRPRIPFVIGADAIAQLHTWKGARFLLDRLHFLVTPRDKIKIPKQLVVEGEPVDLVTTRIKKPSRPETSSTLVREKIAAGEPFEHLMATPEAAAFVKELVATKNVFRKK